MRRKSADENNSGVTSKNKYVTLVFEDIGGTLLPVTMTDIAISSTGQRKFNTNIELHISRIGFSMDGICFKTKRSYLV